MRRSLFLWFALLAPVLLRAEALRTVSSPELWKEFSADRANHANIPDVSYSGFRFGEEPIPDVKVVADVRSEGAKGDGTTDDTAAFRAAIAKAGAAGGGAVKIPAGTYLLSEVLALDKPGVVLRGEGPAKTVLHFSKHLRDLGIRNGAWFGGLIWIGPDAGRGPEAPDEIPVAANTVSVTAPAPQGAHEIQVAAADAARLKPLVGQTLQMVWDGSKDLSLAHHIAGHPSMQTYNWESFRIDHVDGGQMKWFWANEIGAVEGTTVRLRKPLRLAIRPEWPVTISAESPFPVTGCGVESLAIRFPESRKAPHLREVGWNGILFHKAAHCWARDIAIHNADVGINFTTAINCQVSGWTLTGRENHHGTATRGSSHDNRVENFRIESRPMHGINTEGLSSGNVWRRGEMLHGTFDSHCMMSFDFVRTDITLRNTGGPGGAGNHGPFAGRRTVHWNIRVTGGKPDWVAVPVQMSMGAIVGVQGVPLDESDEPKWKMPPGKNKGTVIADHGKSPTPPDLYAAQFELRTKRKPLDTPPAPAGPAASAAAASPDIVAPAPKPQQQPTPLVPPPRATPAPTAAPMLQALPTDLPDRRKVTATALAQFEAKLLARLRESIAGGRPPTFRFARLGRDMQVGALAERQLMLSAPGVTLPVGLDQLTPAERSHLARSVVRADQPSDAALAAFYAVLAGEEAAAARWLTAAGAAASEVRAAFGE